MTRDTFWSIIKKSEAITNADKINEINKEELDKLTPQELLSYYTHFDTLVDEAYRWDLWGAIYIIQGGCGDDSFIDFRYSLISLGETIYTNAVQNPDSLADLDFDMDDDEVYERLGNELFGYIAVELYEEKTGENLFDQLPDSTTEENMGEEFDFDDRDACMERLPRVTQKYWADVQ